jgi:hypothetical protein
MRGAVAGNDFRNGLEAEGKPNMSKKSKTEDAAPAKGKAAAAVAAPGANGAAPKEKGQMVVAHIENEAPVDMRRMAPAGLMSVVFHIVLLGLFALLAPRGQAEVPTETKDETPVQTESADDAKKDPFLTTDVDPAAVEFDTDINYNVDRKADVSVPGTVNPNENVGIMNGDKDQPPTNVPAPGGFGNKGQGGAIEGIVGNTNAAIGEAGGYSLRGMPLAGTFYGRSGATREKALREGGGTGASEAAVARGLQWLARVQSADGRWKLDGNFPDRGNPNDAAGTALGLLPFLAAGKTHRGGKDNPYDKPIDKAIKYLISIQDKKTGAFNRDMYAHGICTIAICEAFGLSQDYALKKPAQRAIDFIVSAQHSAGGWRYQPGQAGDTSVTGWQVMALKSGLMAGLDVPAATIRKAQNYLDGVLEAATEGYDYIGTSAKPTTSAVGLLCRQYLQGWGPQNLRMIKGIDNWIKPNYPKPERKDIYYYYYATQVMHHFGGTDWKAWNDKMRDLLVKTQDKTQGNLATLGSWSPAGDTWGKTGGRLMQTSLSLLTLEVYYRYLPLYYRDNGAAPAAAMAAPGKQ